MPERTLMEHMIETVTMELVLTVETTEFVGGLGVLVDPPLEVPSRFSPFAETVWVRRPDGSKESFAARFVLEDLQRTTGCPHQAVLFLPASAAEKVPVGSQVFVPEGTLQWLRGGDEGPPLPELSPAA